MTSTAPSVLSRSVLVRMLGRHLSEFGAAADGRLFRGTRGGMLSESVYGRIWH